MQKGVTLLVIGNVQSRYLVDKLHCSVFGGDLSVEHALAHITHNHWLPGVKENVKERVHTCPPCNPHNHGYHQLASQPHITTHCLSTLALI